MKSKRVITVGRTADNSVTIMDGSVSRHHCQIVVMRNGMCMVTDLGSSNGTYVNGRRVRNTAYLQKGDELRVGNVIVPWEKYVKGRDKKWLIAIVIYAIVILAAVGISLLATGDKKPKKEPPKQENGLWQPKRGQGKKVVEQKEQEMPKPQERGLKYDYSYRIAYRADLFEGNNRRYTIALPNGDVLYYRYEKDMDFMPTWKMSVWMVDADIRRHYDVACLRTLEDESGYMGHADEERQRLNITFSMMGFNDVGQEWLYMIVKQK